MQGDVITLPCLEDNYAFLLRDAATGTVALIDAPEAGPILSALSARGWRLSMVLITHHHHDHFQALPEVLAATGAAEVMGPAANVAQLPPLTRALHPGDTVAVGGLTGAVIGVPGHTLGHLAYHFPGAGAVFTADSLMALGCGRLMEGTAAQMWASLLTLRALPPETLVCSGHEYTAANARFALTVDAANADLQARAAAITAARARGEATVPSRLAEEIATNPFLRADRAEVKAAIGLSGADDAAVFAEIRRRKDGFRG